MTSRVASFTSSCSSVNCEEFDGPWQIVWMGDRARVPMPELLERRAEVVEKLTIDKFHLAVWRMRRHQARNAVHDQTQRPFAFTKSVLGAPSLVDVRQQHAPLNDVVSGIANRIPNSPSSPKGTENRDNSEAPRSIRARDGRCGGTLVSAASSASRISRAFASSSSDSETRSASTAGESSGPF